MMENGPYLTRTTSNKTQHNILLRIKANYASEQKSELIILTVLYD